MIIKGWRDREEVLFATLIDKVIQIGRGVMDHENVTDDSLKFSEMLLNTIGTVEASRQHLEVIQRTWVSQGPKEESFKLMPENGIE